MGCEAGSELEIWRRPPGLRPPGWLQGNYSECSHGAKRASMALTTSMPPVTEPKTTCLPSSQSVLTVHLRG